MYIAIAFLIGNNKDDIKNDVFGTRSLVICMSFTHCFRTRCIAIQSHNGGLLHVRHCIEKVTANMVTLGIRNPSHSDVWRIRLTQVTVQILKGFPLIHPLTKKYLMCGKKQQLQGILWNIIESPPLLRFLLSYRLL